MLLKQSEPLRFVFPGEDLSSPAALSFQYREPSALALARYRDRAISVDGGTAKAATDMNEQLLRLAFDCLTGWTGYVGPDGSDVPFSWEEFQAFPGKQMLPFIAHLLALIAPGPDEGKGSASRSAGG